MFIYVCVYIYIKFLLFLRVGGEDRKKPLLWGTSPKGCGVVA